MSKQNYYVPRTPKMLKDFDKTANIVRNSVGASYGSNFADTLYQETRQEYEALIPQIPHIEGLRGSMLNSFLLITAQEVAVYQAMKKRGKTAGEAWEICHEALKLGMERYSKLKRWLLERIMHSGILIKRMRKLAETGKQPRFGDFEVRYVIGDGEEFDFGVDYMACGNYKFVLDQGAEEFAPYVCMSDIALSNALGWGLIRTETLADGCERCDFRFKKGAKHGFLPRLLKYSQQLREYPKKRQNRQR